MKHLIVVFILKLIFVSFAPVSFQHLELYYRASIRVTKNVNLMRISFDFRRHFDCLFYNILLDFLCYKSNYLVFDKFYISFYVYLSTVSISKKCRFDRIKYHRSCGISRTNPDLKVSLNSIMCWTHRNG